MGVAAGPGVPPDSAAREDFDPIICRCEAVALGALLAAREAWGADDLRQLKLLTRAGMGLCQGRVCRPLLESLAKSWGWDPTGALASRPPSRPWPMGQALEPESGAPGYG